jgi:hypothetical protein
MNPEVFPGCSSCMPREGLLVLYKETDLKRPVRQKEGTGTYMRRELE